MPWQCGSCGVDTSRGKKVFDEKGNVRSEVCPSCSPEQFEGGVTDPSDKKIYSGPQAMPNLYTRDAEGTYHAKDELISDTVQNWDHGPTAKAEAKKRATRRTEPLTAVELARANRWGKEVLAPLLEARGMGAVVGALHPEPVDQPREPND